MRESTYSNWDTLQGYQKQALDTIADKISRILTGDPTYLDNWHDIQGYAKLVENILTTGKSHPTSTVQEIPFPNLSISNPVMCRGCHLPEPQCKCSILHSGGKISI